MLSNGCRLEVEIINNNLIHITISSLEEDLYKEIVHNDSEVIDAIVRLLKEYDRI